MPRKKHVAVSSRRRLAGAHLCGRLPSSPMILPPPSPLALAPAPLHVLYERAFVARTHDGGRGLGMELDNQCIRQTCTHGR